MAVNIQPIEKSVVSNGQTLDVRSIFYTIQGEGPMCGKPAVFIRLAGCNLQCPGCDTDYTANREQLSVPQIMQRVELAYEQFADFHIPLIVITGGEPLRQNIAVLVSILSRRYKVQIETNGTVGIADPTAFELADIVCSPKTGKVHPSITARACAFKYVLHHESVSVVDGLPILALDHSASPQVYRPPLGRTIFLQPMDCKDPIVNRKNQEAVLASCLKFGYVLGYQLHKILEVE